MNTATSTKSLISFLVLFMSIQLSAQQGQQYIQTEMQDLLKQNKLLEDDTSFVITAEHQSNTSGVYHAYYKQTFNGIEINGTESSIHIKNNGVKISAHNRELIKDIKSIAPAASAPKLSAEQAIMTVAAIKGYPVGTLNIVSELKTPDRAVVFDKSTISRTNIPIKLAYQKMRGNTLVLSWDLAIHEVNSSDYWNIQLDATTGKILKETNWTVYCNTELNHSHDAMIGPSLSDDHTHNNDSAFAKANTSATPFVGNYDVYAAPLESPGFGGRTTVANPADGTVLGSPFGWHDTNGVSGGEFTIARGNNAHGYEDGDNPGFSPDGGASLDFTEASNPIFAVNPVYSAGDQSEEAAVVNVFYWSNIIHDIMYVYGFDAAAGTFQENNYGSATGVGGDYVLAEAQDGSGTCNANFATPPDGNRPRMQMYVCGSRDGDFDNGVIVHEYGHGISTRLTGGAGTSGCLGGQEQMGEGWSDYYALMLTMDATDNPTDARPIGTWLVGQPTNGPGIRDFPYSTDFAVDPRTYDAIKTASIPHGVGSTWTTMLWEMTWDLIAAYGGTIDSDIYNYTGSLANDAGNIKAMAIVTEGLKMQPCLPGLVDGRDALLAADEALYGGAHYCLIWESFRKRGLGGSADQGSSASRSDGVEAFDPPLTRFDYSGGELCGSDGVQVFGGGFPSGGTYSGNGVTDDGNGSTFSFDPAVVGTGITTVTYTVPPAKICDPVADPGTATVDIEVVVDPVIVCVDGSIALDASGTATLDPEALDFLVGKQLTIVGGNDQSGDAGFTIHQVPITQDVTVSFDYNYSTADSPNFDGFGYTIDDDYFEITGGAQTSSFSVSLTAGQLFGVGVQTDDNQFGAGTVVISNFNEQFGGQFDEANWTLLNQDADGTANFGDLLGPLVQVTKNCGSSFTVTSSKVDFDCGDIGDTMITLTVTDNLGNVTDCTTTITVTGGTETRFEGGAWTAGVPTGASSVVIADNYNTATSGNIEGCACEVASGNTLTIGSGEYLRTQGNITIDGTLIIEHQGSVVQIDDDAGVIKGASGIIEVRKTTPLIEPLGFMFLSSPMTSETRDGAYDSAFRVLEIVSPNFVVDPALVTTDPLDPYFGAEIFLGPDNSFLNNYVAAETLLPGDGLVVYPQPSIDAGNQQYPLTYTKGTLNNGQIEYPIVYNGLTENNFNLLGNPYPSAIDVNALINGNDMINEVFFWEHLTGPSNTIPGYLGNNYSMNDISIRNLAGATAASNGGTPRGRYIASGQGFAVKAVQGGSTNATFNNAMRVVDNNDQYRSNTDEDRLWLRIENDDYAIKSTNLIAFLPQASEGLDAGYDSRRIGTAVSIFTKVKTGELLGIQARESFDSSIQIDLGVGTVIEEALSYTVDIEHIEGDGLAQVPVYLVDKLLETYVNLKERSYTFTTTKSLQANRFVIAFEAPEILGIEESSLSTEIRLYPNPAQGFVNLSYTGKALLKKAVLYDVTGKRVKEFELAANAGAVKMDISTLNAGVYFMRMQSADEIVVKRLIIK